METTEITESCGCVTVIEEATTELYWRTVKPCTRHIRYASFPYRVRAKETADD